MKDLTVQQKIEIAIAKAKELRKRAQDEAKLDLLKKVDYIGYRAMIEEEAEIVAKLTAIMDNLNQIKPIVTNDGTKYSIHCYPVAEYVFGPVMSRVLGIATASSAMFTDERQLEFEALTGISHLLATSVKECIGNPAYYSKGVKVEAVPSNGNFSNPLIAVCDSLGIDIAYANKVNSNNLTRWFEVADKKATKAEEEFKRTELLDSTSNFVLED